MSSNYFYDKLPGARLVVGPHGRLDEQLGLGACCASCAKTGGCCSKDPLGAALTPQRLAQPMTVMPTPSPPATDTSSIVPYLVVAGVGVVGFLLLLRRRR